MTVGADVGEKQQDARGDCEVAEALEDEHDSNPAARQPPSIRHLENRTLLVVLVVIIGLGALAGWLGYRTHQAREVEEQRAVFLQTGRQVALNLTSIDFAEVDADVKRVMDASTGSFLEQFQSNSAAFAETVRQAQATSVGTITEAGIESVDGDSAKILVAASVNTSSAGAAEQQPRIWRMRVTVQRSGDAVKVSNVDFVP